MRRLVVLEVQQKELLDPSNGLDHNREVVLVRVLGQKLDGGASLREIKMRKRVGLRIQQMMSWFEGGREAAG